jgi:hypothetical protein
MTGILVLLLVVAIGPLAVVFGVDSATPKTAAPSRTS